MLTIDMVGNRFWVQSGELVCAPINADGTLDIDNVCYPEALSDKAAEALRTALLLLEDEHHNW